MTEDGMTTTETQAAPLAQLAATVRRLHADGWTYHPASGEYRRGRHTIEPEILTHDWISVALYHDEPQRYDRLAIARLGWAPNHTGTAALFTLIAGLS